MHSEKPKAKNGKAMLTPNPSLKSQIARFKADVRKLKLYCCDIEDAWIFQACKSPLNRLREVAITNKHAAILGMPRITKEDATAIVTNILAIKNATSTKTKGGSEAG